MPVCRRTGKLLGLSVVFAEQRVAVGELKPVCVILNPASGGGAGARRRPEIERELSRRGVRFDLFETRGPGAGLQIARDCAKRGVSTIVAAGGDGTAHEVANGILQARTGGCALGLLPIGTGNDFVKVVPGTADRAAAYDTIARGKAALYDVGRARWGESEEYFINGMGTGIDVEVVRQLRHLPHLPGSLKYLLALLRALVRFQPPTIRVRIDDEQLERQIMIVAVGNGVCQGGGFYLAPDASPSDGVLDICLVERLSLAGIARVIPKVMRGTQRGDPKVFMRTTRAVRIEALDGRALFFHLDGELHEPDGLQLLEVEVLPGALPVLTGEGKRE
jgi:YegS/Rv2252/BmrU family lipid kinase